LLRNIEIDAFLKELGDDQGGMSKPILVIGNDGETYLLKNQNVYDPRFSKWVFWDCMFLQEALVYEIAKFLDLKIPEGVIMNVEQDFLNHAPALTFKHRYTPGLHFASKFIEGSENNLKTGYENLLKMGKPYVKTSWNHFYKKIDNINDIPKIIALDLLTGNFDRFGNNGNLLIVKNQGTREVYVIDHGHCFFKAHWDIPKQRGLLNAGNTPQYIEEIMQAYLQLSGGKPMSGLGETFKALEQHINVENPDDHSFLDVVLKIESITPKIIDQWFSSIPNNWFVDKATQLHVYKNYIMAQKDLIGTFINEMAKRGAFTSTHTGGVLNWKKKKTGTQ
jgi:hypothetical protein